MIRRKSAQRDIMQTYIENEQKEFVPPEPQLVPVEKYNRKICIIKPETKRTKKKKDALQKRLRNFRIRPAMKSQGVKENRK